MLYLSIISMNIFRFFMMLAICLNSCLPVILLLLLVDAQVTSLHSLGIPSIAMAQNQREEKHGFVCNENGFSYIGLNPSDEIIEGILKMYMNLSKEAREKLHGKLLSHNLRDGRKRVMSLIRGL